MSFAKFKQVLVYVGLSFSFLFASVGVSNAGDHVSTFEFTATAEVCDPMDSDQDTPGSLIDVTVDSGSSLNLGPVTAGDTEFIEFDITATNPLDCLETDLGFDDIFISYSDVVNFSTSGSCVTDDTACAVQIVIPSRVTTLSGTITFSYTP